MWLTMLTCEDVVTLPLDSFGKVFVKVDVRESLNGVLIMIFLKDISGTAWNCEPCK